MAVRLTLIRLQVDTFYSSLPSHEAHSLLWKESPGLPSTPVTQGISRYTTSSPSSYLSFGRTPLVCLTRCPRTFCPAPGTLSGEGQVPMWEESIDSKTTLQISVSNQRQHCTPKIPSYRMAESWFTGSSPVPSTGSGQEFLSREGRHTPRGFLITSTARLFVFPYPVRILVWGPPPLLLVYGVPVQPQVLLVLKLQHYTTLTYKPSAHLISTDQTNLCSLLNRNIHLSVEFLYYVHLSQGEEISYSIKYRSTVHLCRFRCRRFIEIDS